MKRLLAIFRRLFSRDVLPKPESDSRMWSKDWKGSERVR